MHFSIEYKISFQTIME